MYRRNGYLTRALGAWDEAWQLAKNDPAPFARAVADAAVANWLELSTKLARTDDLAARLKEIEKRAVNGSAAAKIGLAREGLWAMQYQHHLGVGSGALALDAILAMTRGERPDVPKAIADDMPTPAGTSLLQLQRMATNVGMHLQVGARSGGVPIPAGSVVHFKAGHFSAIVRAEGNRYLLRDSILGGYLWVSQNALNDEASGYFLIPEGSLPEGWRTPTDTEAEAIIGHCAPGAPDPDDPNCGGPGGPPPPAGPGDPTSPGGGCAGCGMGMATYTFMSNQVSLRITDTPIGYAPSRGPGGFFQVTYNQRYIRQPQIFSFWSLGAKWQRIGSHITDDPRSLGIISVYLRSGWSGIWSETTTSRPLNTGVLARKLYGRQQPQFGTSAGSAMAAWKSSASRTASPTRAAASS